MEDKSKETPVLRKTFENELQQLKDEILLLGSMVEQSIMTTWCNDSQFRQHYFSFADFKIA